MQDHTNGPTFKFSSDAERAVFLFITGSSKKHTSREISNLTGISLANVQAALIELMGQKLILSRSMTRTRNKGTRADRNSAYVTMLYYRH